MWGDMGGGGFGLFGAVTMASWWALLIAGIAVLIKWPGGGPRRPAGPAGDRALDALRDRQARVRPEDARPRALTG